MNPPLSEREGKAIVAMLMSIGSVSSNLLIHGFGIKKKRALQLQKGNLSKKDKAMLDGIIKGGDHASL